LRTGIDSCSLQGARSLFAANVFPETARANPSGHLEVGGCDVTALAAWYGTPLYVFDVQTLQTACRRYRAAFGAAYPGELNVSYACKAFLCFALARLILAEGLGFDVVSIDELRAVLNCGARAEHVHFHGNAKPRRELEEALNLGIGRVVVDNLDELHTLATLTAGCAKPQGLLVRLEPAVSALTHASIQTGQRGSKFGLPLELLDSVATVVKAAPGLAMKGLHCHLGSQLFDVSVYERAIIVLLDAATHLRDKFGINIEEISPGGGFAAAYLEEDGTPDVHRLATVIGRSLVRGCAERNLPLPRLTVEPGRSICARAGIGVYEVIGTKPLEPTEGQPAVRYLHVDGGMGDNPRPALYDARYTAVLANDMRAARVDTVHIAGRYCESGDVLVKNAMFPPEKIGDLVALGGAGAYTLCLSSNYNMVPRPAVVFVADGIARIVQRRETFDDLIRRENG
jgi:diaminopimelate decarboxylase